MMPEMPATGILELGGRLETIVSEDSFDCVLLW